MGISWKRTFNLIAFIALVIVAVALVLAKIFSGNAFSSALSLIAQLLAYIVVIFYAFIYAWKGGTDKSGKMGTRQIIQLIIWVVATVLVILFLFLNTSF